MGQPGCDGEGERIAGDGQVEIEQAMDEQTENGAQASQRYEPRLPGLYFRQTSQGGGDKDQRSCEE